ncbi:MAG: efflux RND transporter permease subunit [Myxococcales bacterium]|nr:efflux RND transporter permease subunit [Myxococcales bacterium]
MAAVFLRSKLTPLIIVGVTLFGALAVYATPRTYNPDVVVPVVNIMVSRPGRNAADMLDQVVKPLEALLGSLPGVDHTYGQAETDRAIVTVRFDVGEDEERSLVKVYNQINSNLDRIPPGTAPPLIQAVSLYDVPIVTLALYSDTLAPDTLRGVAEHVVEQLRSVPGVGKTTVSGASRAAVRVDLDPARLAAYGLDVDAVAGAIAQNNVNRGAGDVAYGGREHPLRVAAALGSADDVRGVMVGSFDGKPVFLGDVADVRDGPADDRVRSSIAFGPADPQARPPRVDHSAVTIGVARKKGTNGVTVARDVLARLHAVERAALPEGVHVTVTRDDGVTADDAVNTLMEHLVVAIATVVVILLVSLGWREASIVTLSIPLILFVVLGAGWVAGQTINRITLFALILSLGLLVDDSIVVIENIHRHAHLRGPRRGFDALVVEAANEIGRPTIVATFTVILALIPMAFVTGMMGPFMGPIPFNAPIAMLASLIIAYTVVPYLAWHWLRRKNARVMEAVSRRPLEQESVQQADRLHRAYTRLLIPLLDGRRRRRFFLGGVVALLFVVMLQPAWQLVRPQGADGPLSPFGVELKMLPDDNVDTLLVEVDAPLGTAREQTARIAEAVGEVIGSHPQVTDYQTFVGEPAPEDFAAMVRGDAARSGPQLAQIRVGLVGKHARDVGSHAIAQELYDALAPVRAAFPRTRIKILETPPGPPVRSQMMAALYGPDYDTLRSLGGRIRADGYGRVYGMINQDDSVGDDVEELRLAVDRDAATSAGVAPAQIAQTLETYFAGRAVGDIEHTGSLEPVPIVLRLPRQARTDPHLLDTLTLMTPQGARVPLSTIARLERRPADKRFYTRDQYPTVYVSGNMLRSSPVYAVTSLTRALSGAPVDGGTLEVGNLGFVRETPSDLRNYQLHWLGEMRLTLDVFRDLGAAFMVALVLIYLLLVGYYQSFLMPVVVMIAIPITLIGVFPGHWLLGQPFTATSMIGVIALAGIVVRNALLLIDFIVERRVAGEPLRASVIEAGAVRLRPILLTALTVVFGSATMLADPVFGGLAISLIFGILASTVLTLLVIPLIYYLWQRRAEPA